MSLGGGGDRNRIHIAQVQDEFIRVLRFNPVGRQDVGREIPQIDGDDYV